SALAKKMATARWPLIPNGTGVAYPAGSGEELQTTRPVFLSNAVPALPALRNTRSPSTSAEPAKLHSGSFNDSSSAMLRDQIVLPDAASRQSTCPFLLNVNTRSPSMVGVAPG